MMTKTLRLGIAGLGTVGAGVVKIIQDNAALLEARAECTFEITAICARDKTKDRGVDLSGVDWCDDPTELASRDDVDVVLEMIGGEGDPAKALVEQSLANGKSVITANKALLAYHGRALANVAESHGASLAYEAAVAGGIPIIKALREGFVSNKINAIYGILNGTCNYILTSMRETRRDFDVVLKEAQELGYAEAEPSLDVDGYDAAHKAAILASIAYGCAVDFDSVPVTGIRFITLEDIDFAEELGYRIKLLGVARSIDGRRLEHFVAPCLVPKANPLASIEDAFNAVVVEGDFVDMSLLVGRGAGAGPTATAVVADLVDVAQERNTLTYNIPVSNLKEMDMMPETEQWGQYYVRMQVLDHPGVMAAVSATFGDHHISMESVMQRGRSPDMPVSLVLKTHETSDAAMENAISSLMRLECVLGTPIRLRIIGA